VPIADDVQLGLTNRFLVTVIPSSRSLGSWAKAEGLDVTWEVPDYRAGDSWNQRWFFPGFTKYTNVKLSRAANAKDTEEVKKWLDEVATKFTVGNIQVELRDAQNTGVFTWELRNALPVKWSIGGFDATQSKVAIETLELTHLGFLADDKM
jgi:phage tail-like protein